MVGRHAMSTTQSTPGTTTGRFAREDQFYEDESRGGGWVLFAGVMLAIVGTLNLIDGIAAVSNSTFFVGEAKFILSGLNTWGWVLIVMGVVQGLTAIGVWMRTTGVRWLGVTIAALNAIAQMFMMPSYPLWSLLLFTLDILVIYGLVVHGARRHQT
jgi:uncharacterized membrane protein HdeD (DUF308 family)